MADGFQAIWHTDEFERSLIAKARAADVATKAALKTSSRKLQSAARKRAPVYKGPGAVSVRDVRRARKAGLTLSGERLLPGQVVEGKGQVVAGLLRDSTKAGPVRQVGIGRFRVLVGPRGPRVFLYARKEEDRAHFMAGALGDVRSEMRAIHEQAWVQAFKTGRG